MIILYFRSDIFLQMYFEKIGLNFLNRSGVVADDDSTSFKKVSFENSRNRGNINKTKYGPIRLNCLQNWMFEVCDDNGLLIACCVQQ